MDSKVKGLMGDSFENLRTLIDVNLWQIAYAAKESGKAKAKRAREEAAARLDEAEKARAAREEELKRQAVEEYLRGKSDKDNEDNEGKK